MDALDEFYERNPSARGYLDNSTKDTVQYFIF